MSLDTDLRGDDKVSSDDFNEPVLLYRTITATATPSVVPGSQPSLDTQFLKRLASRILMRVWIQAAAAGETATLNLLLLPIAGELSTPKDGLSIARQQAGGIDLATLVYTCSGKEYTNIHPVTGVSVASTKFFEASAVSITNRLHADLVRFAPDLADAVNYPATGKQLVTIIDMFGHNGLFVGATAKSGGATSIIIGAERVT